MKPEGKWHTLTNIRRRFQGVKMRDPGNEVVLESLLPVFLGFSQQLSLKLMSAHFIAAINETEIA